MRAARAQDPTALLNNYITQFKEENKDALKGVAVNFYGITAPGDGYLYVPDTLNTLLSLFPVLNKLQPSRPLWAMQEYFEKTPEGQRSLVIGSGLLQEALQKPLTNTPFSKPFYVDPEQRMAADIVDFFNEDFLKRNDVSPFKGSFDSIYLDNFPELYSSPVLKAAFEMLKPGGLLKMTLRRGYTGLQAGDFLPEESQILGQGRKTDEQKESFDNALSQAIFRKLINLGFSDNPADYGRLKTLESIREYGFPYQHLYILKKQ